MLSRTDKLKNHNVRGEDNKKIKSEVIKNVKIVYNSGQYIIERF